MSTLFNWLPNTLGLTSETDEFKKNCYKYYGGDAPRWGGFMDSCEVGGDVYTLAFNFLGFVGSLATVVGGYMLLQYAKNASFDTSSKINTEYDSEKPTLTLK